MIKIFRTILTIFWLSLTVSSCVITKYVNCNKDCLVNNPDWKIYVDIIPLKDLFIRVDSLNRKGTVKKTLGDRTTNFEFFELFTTMNRELPQSTVPNPNRKPIFIERTIKINLYVSDTLNETTIAMLNKEDFNGSVEKGYFARNSFLYINDYQTNTYLLVNLRTKIVYKLEQDKENLRQSNRALKDFVRNGCYQGIQFLTVGGAFSLGDTLGF